MMDGGIGFVPSLIVLVIGCALAHKDVRWLETIVLSVFVLLSQNRQVARDRVRNDIEYEVNLRAELEVAHLHGRIDDMNAELLARLDRLERAVTPPKSAGT